MVKTHSKKTKLHLSAVKREKPGKKHTIESKTKLIKNKNNGKQTNIILKNPFGENVGPIYNVKKFGIENGIDSRRIYELVSGKRQEYHGWFFVNGSMPCKNRNKSIFLVKNNIIYGPIINLRKFCDEHNIIRTNVYQLLKGKRISVNGFELYQNQT